MGGFDMARPARLQARIGEMSVPVIGREHLLRNKRAAGRPRDLADVAWLESSEPTDRK
jgi:hypothetical protein